MAKLEVQYVYRHLVATRNKRNEPPARPGSDRAGVWYMGDPAAPWGPSATPGAPPWSGFVAFHQLAFCSPGRSRPHLGMGGVFFSSEGVCAAYLRPVRPWGGYWEWPCLPLPAASQGCHAALPLR